MKSSLWLVIVIVGVWLGFLFGYAVSSHTGPSQRAAVVEAEAQAGAGGYGGGGGGASAGGYGR
ncbi:MAG: hypothetical protein JSW09_02025 [Pseudomonadota bacterium]|nr:MAG: hypothetical protein JSW09_02025 [Pseudomonadota bacterium]